MCILLFLDFSVWNITCWLPTMVAEEIAPYHVPLLQHLMKWSVYPLLGLDKCCQPLTTSLSPTTLFLLWSYYQLFFFLFICLILFDHLCCPYALPSLPYHCHQVLCPSFIPGRAVQVPGRRRGCLLKVASRFLGFFWGGCFNSTNTLFISPECRGSSFWFQHVNHLLR